MDPQHSAQDVVRCDICDCPVPPLHCDFCHLNLCKICVGDHLLESSQKHQVVPYQERGRSPNYPSCPIHAKEQCKYFCEECDNPICVHCISTGIHQNHNLLDILNIFERKRGDLQNDLKELEESIFPEYEDFTTSIQKRKTDLYENSKELVKSVEKQGEELHKEIDNIVQKLKSEIQEKDSNNMALLKEKENEITLIMSDIKQDIAKLQKLLKSNDGCLVSTYKSRNAEFRILPPRINVSIPNFAPQILNKEILYEQFGKLFDVCIITEEPHHTIEISKRELSPIRPLLDKPRIIKIFDTEYGDFQKELLSVACLSDEEIWACGNNDNTMRLYNLQGKLLESIKTKSGNEPQDIAVTKSGDLVYTDYINRTVNIVKNNKVQEVIKLLDWIPRCVCSTSSDDLLVIMDNENDSQTKIVRYSGSMEKQSIEFDDKGQPLYSSGPFVKCMSENRNQDICVADWGARAVVVVNVAGKRRFRYTGNPSTSKRGKPSTTRRSFEPCGIATDSQSLILTADRKNHHVHILHQDGHFLRYIGNGDLHSPMGLCLDSKDNLFVAEWGTGKIKKIQYYK